MLVLQTHQCYAHVKCNYRLIEQFATLYDSSAILPMLFTSSNMTIDILYKVCNLTNVISLIKYDNRHFIQGLQSYQCY